VALALACLLACPLTARAQRFVELGGAGVYDVRGNRKVSDWGIGASAGVGISVPIHAKLRAFVETRYHLLFGTTAELPWIVPVTFGVRF
jgi:hypothetical protein